MADLAHCFGVKDTLVKTYVLKEFKKNESNNRKQSQMPPKCIQSQLTHMAQILFFLFIGSNEIILTKALS